MSNFLNENDINHQDDQYHPGDIPPNWLHAKNHRNALKAGIENFESTKIHPKICYCCAKQYNKEKISINTKSSNLAFLGIGYPLYL